MDDLIIAGTLSIIGLYAAAVFSAAVILMIIIEIAGAAGNGDADRILAVTGAVLIFITAYAGTGFWLKKSGRI